MRSVKGAELCGLCHAGILHPGRLKDEEGPYDGGAGSHQTDHRQLSGGRDGISGGSQQPGE